MSPSAMPASIYQVGTQAALGTGVAATSRLVVPSLGLQATDDVNRPQLVEGMLRSPGHEVVQARGTNWSVPAHELNYEQLPGWLGASVEGGVSATGGDAPYTWTFTRDPYEYPDLDPLTIERRLGDWTAHIDERVIDAVASRLTIAGQRGGMVTLAVDGFAKRRETSTLTASLAAPAVEHAPYPLSKVSIDGAWASLGTTPITGQVLSWSMSLMTGAVGISTAGGNADLDYDVLVIDGRQVGIEFTARLMQTKARYEAERAAAEALSLRAVRVAIAGTSDRAVTLDALLKYSAGSLTEVDESDGQVVYDITLQETTDGTNLFEATVTNNVDDEWGTLSA